MRRIAMNKESKNNFADVLAMKVRYAVLTKKGRIEVLVKPSSKQLRKRGKKGWHLYRTVESHSHSNSDAAHLLEESFRGALAEIEGTPSYSNGKRRKPSITEGKLLASR
jgi:hypothetical protein